MSLLDVFVNPAFGVLLGCKVKTDRYNASFNFEYGGSSYRLSFSEDYQFSIYTNNDNMIGHSIYEDYAKDMKEFEERWQEAKKVLDRRIDFTKHLLK